MAGLFRHRQNADGQKQNSFFDLKRRTLLIVHRLPQILAACAERG
jgi:hypothetical protein